MTAAILPVTYGAKLNSQKGRHGPLTRYAVESGYMNGYAINICNSLYFNLEGQIPHSLADSEPLLPLSPPLNFLVFITKSNTLFLVDYLP